MAATGHGQSRAAATFIYIKTSDSFFFLLHCSSGGGAGRGSHAADTSDRAQWPSVTGFLGVAAGTDGGEAVLFPSPRAAQHRWWIYLSWGHLSGETRWYSHYPNGKLILPAPICVVTRFHLSMCFLSAAARVLMCGVLGRRENRGTGTRISQYISTDTTTCNT